LTVADVVLLGRVAEQVRSWNVERRVCDSLRDLVRWFWQVQNELGREVVCVGGGLEWVDVDVKELTDIYAKRSKKTVDQEVKEVGVAKDVKKKSKEARKPGKDSDKPKSTPAASTPVRAVDPSWLDLRVGRIISCERHPDADSLYVEQIDVGEATPRQVVSGLVRYIPLDQMNGAWVLLLCNLKPANMRGVRSSAMVLCATSADGQTVELVRPPAASMSVGDRVVVEGCEEGEPEPVLNPKKKIWETVQPGLKTNEDRVAGWWNEAAGKFCRMKVMGKDSGDAWFRTDTVAGGGIK